MKPILYKVETYIVPETELSVINKIENVTFAKQFNIQSESISQNNTQNEEDASFALYNKCEELARFSAENSKLIDVKIMKDITNENETIDDHYDADIVKYYSNNNFCGFKERLHVPKKEFQASVGPQEALYPARQFSRVNSLVSIDEKSETSLDTKLNDFCRHGYKNGCTASIPSPEEVSNEIFRENWLRKIEVLRDREAILREKEVNLQKRERELFRKEKELRIMERVLSDKMKQVDQQLEHQKDMQVVKRLEQAARILCGEVGKSNNSEEKIPKKNVTKKEDILKKEEAPKKEEVSKKVQIPGKTEISKSAEIPKIEIPKYTEILKSEIQKRIEIPKYTEISKSAEIPKRTEILKSMEIQKRTEIPKYTEISKSAEILKRTEIPKYTEISKSAEIPKRTEILKSMEIQKRTEIPKYTEISKSAEILKRTEIPKYTEISKSAEILKSVGIQKSTEILKRAEIPKNPQFVNPCGREEETNKKVVYLMRSNSSSRKSSFSRTHSFATIRRKERRKNYDDLDSSLSAASVDTPNLRTSQWFNPALHQKPHVFTRSASERWTRHKSIGRLQQVIEEKPEHVIKEEKIFRKFSDNICALQEKETRFQNYGLVDYIGPSERNSDSKEKLASHLEEIGRIYQSYQSSQSLTSVSKDRPVSWTNETDERPQKKRQMQDSTTKRLAENKENMCNQTETNLPKKPKKFFLFR